MSIRRAWPIALLATMLAGSGCEAVSDLLDTDVIGDTHVQPPDGGDQDTLVPEDVDRPDVPEPTDLNDSDTGPTDPGTADPDVAGDPGTPDIEEPPQPSPYLIVYQDDLVDAADLFAAYRQSTGYEVETVSVSSLVSGGLSNRSLITPIRNRLNAMIAQAAPGTTAFLLLLGDAPTSSEANAGRIPAVACENDTIGADPGDCWTDNPYGDLDGDGVPEVAVGRVPARSHAQARDYLDKVKDHESSYEPGLWNRRISIYTGEANFGAEIDALLEYAMFEGLKAISHDFDIIGAYDNKTSDYYYTPFEDKVVELFNQGNLMTVYVGHGDEDWTQGLTTEQIARIDCRHRLPVVFFFACYAGNYAGNNDSLVETLLWKDGGAVAAIGSTDVSHPYGNAVLAYEVPRAALDERQPTAGQVLMRAKQLMVDNQGDDFRTMVSASAFIALDQMGDDTPLATIEYQHCDLYNLVGDPAVAMKYPRLPVQVNPPPRPLTPGSMTVTGTVPGLVQGSAYVTLEVERDRYVHPLTPVDPKRPSQAVIQANWAKANDKIIVGLTVPVTNGAFTAELTWDTGVVKAGDWIKVLAHDGSVDGGLAPSTDGVGSVRAY